MELKNKVVVVSGTSGSGKTTLVNFLLDKKELNLSFSISACTRGKRPLEVNGEHYMFLSKLEFKNKVQENKFLEWEEVYPNNFYGTLKHSTESLLLSGKNILFDIDVKGALSIKNYYGNRARTIYVQPSSIESIKTRLINRKTESQADLEERIKKMEQEISLGEEMDVKLINDDLDLAKFNLYKEVKSFLET